MKVFDSEIKLMEIIWEHEPVTSMDLVQLCAQQFDWKKSTTYTMLKRLQEKGFVKNDRSVVTSLISQEAVRAKESRNFVTETFKGSLPSFIAAFLGGETISEEEAEELKKLIDSYRG